jgi:hypothetical protein
VKMLSKLNSRMNKKPIDGKMSIDGSVESIESSEINKDSDGGCFFGNIEVLFQNS